MDHGLHLNCRCGNVVAALDPAALALGTHVHCYCRDCQAFARHLGAQDLLAAGGASPIYQTTPDHLHILHGAEYLACLRLGPKGLIRWYARCCSTPMANTLPTSKIPFVGILAWTFPDPAPLGAVRAVGFAKQALKETHPAPRDRGTMQLFVRFLRRWVVARMSGQACQTPFRNSEGALISQPDILTRAQRKMAEKV